ncbi:hypothetical protein [Glycomyces sp. NPDC048151]|uniref:hypothetical protein n=1 Tax=Glycomyces sp. NPDC048151 TaxID=3364002 RepID=UPI00371AD52F
MPIGPTRADLAKHTCAGRAWFGLGPRRCECGERWGEFGCPERVSEFIAYLQVSTESDRAQDLQNNSHLFTTFEATTIAANDQRSQRQRAKARQQGLWSPPYPAGPSTATVPQQRRPQPYPMESVAA